MEEVTAKLGKMTEHVERSVLNPRTNKFFAFPDHWAAPPVNYRADLWDQVRAGLRPSTWDDRSAFGQGTTRDGAGRAIMT